jgi:hypothetical protein
VALECVPYKRQPQLHSIIFAEEILNEITILLLYKSLVAKFENYNFGFFLLELLIQVVFSVLIGISLCKNLSINYF